MIAGTESLFRRALNASPAAAGAASGGAAQVFTQGFLNASMLQLAVCAPPRAAATTRRYAEVYITEPGEGVRAKKEEREVLAV